MLWGVIPIFYLLLGFDIGQQKPYRNLLYVEIMNLLENKLAQYTIPQRAMAMGIYPYFKEIEGKQSTEVLISGKQVLMFGSNSYLGLSDHPALSAAAKEAIDNYGTSCAGSRFLNGTLDIHSALERRLAKFLGKEAVIIFTTGFQVNEGVLSCLVGRGDYIIWDEQVHASIIDGLRLSFGQSLKFRHNDMEALERRLQQCDPEKIKLIIVDGVYSMEGDLANLPEIVRLAKLYNASIMVDEAHSVGVFGKDGRGICNELGLTDDIDLIGGTFSKSFGSLGGFVAGSETTINFLRHNARSYIFSASCTPASTASAGAALDIFLNEPERRQALWDNTNYALKRFRELGFEIGGTASPIIPLYVRDYDLTLLVTKEAYEQGVFINPVVPPAVASSDTLIRFSLMATHTREQIDRAVEVLHNIFRKYEIIRS